MSQFPSRSLLNAISPPPGGIAARCHSAGCSYADIASAIEDRYDTSINPRRYDNNPTTVNTRTTTTSRTSGPGPKAQDLRPYAINLWHQSVPIPNSREHPARMWLASRHLWRPELPLPGAVRWIRSEHLHHDFQGAGAIIAMAAPPDAWLTSWPSLPDLSSVSGSPRTQKVHRRHPHRSRGQCPHIGRLHSSRTQPLGR